MLDLTCSKERLVVRPGESGDVDITIANRLDEPVTCMVAVSKRDAPPPEPAKKKPRRRKKDADRSPMEWTFPAQVRLDAGQTDSVRLSLAASPQADVGDYTYELLVADERNPDERFAVYSLPVITLPLPEATKRNWWPLIIIIAIILLFILLVIILTRPTYRPVPQVVGLTLDEAIAALEDSGLQAEVIETTGTEFDMEVMENLLAVRAKHVDKQHTAWLALPEDEQEEVDEPVLPDQLTAATYPPIVENLVWYRDDDDIRKSGDAIPIKVVSPLVPLPNVRNKPLPKAMQILADSGLRFTWSTSLPSNHIYSHNKKIRKDLVINTTPNADTPTLSWNQFWEPLLPERDDEETENEESTDDSEDIFYVYRGSRIHLHVLPVKITVPDFTAMKLDQVLQQTAYNIIYRYENRKIHPRTISIGSSILSRTRTRLLRPPPSAQCAKCSCNVQPHDHLLLGIGEHQKMTRPLCFVIMPFGTKPDPRTGIQVDFNDIYERGIRPGIEQAELTPLRADHEQSGGTIHSIMFERLLLCDYAIADLTTANANVFYELGIRHAARPSTTLPIMSDSTLPPFDLNMLRCLPYHLEEDGTLTEQAAIELQGNIYRRPEGLRDLQHNGNACDSPYL